MNKFINQFGALLKLWLVMHYSSNRAALNNVWIGNQVAIFLLIAIASISSPLKAERIAINDDLFDGVENFGFKTTVKVNESSGGDHFYQTSTYSNFFSKDGMFKSQMTAVNKSGVQVINETVSYDGTQTYFQGPPEHISLAKGLKLSSYLLDTITRTSLYPFQFLFFNRLNPLDPASLEYRPDYKAAYIGNLLDIELWRSAEKSLLLKSSDDGDLTYEVPVSDFTYPESEEQLKLVFYQKPSVSIFPYRIEKRNAKNEVLEEFSVKEWMDVTIPLGASKAPTSIKFPKRADYKANRVNYSTQFIYSDVIINSPELKDPDFFSADFSSARQFYDADNKVNIKAPN